MIMAEERTHTARVHAWYVDSEGDETHVTRRDDGKWYLNPLPRDKEAVYVSMEEAVDAFVLAAQERRPHRTVSGLPDGKRWDEALAAALEEAGLGPEKDEAEDAPQGEG